MVGRGHPVESIMGGRTFVKFHLDVGIGDVVLDPLEQAEMRDWLGFAGISPPSVPMIQREQQFAEKLHAYTLPRTGAPNSRVRDLVDMVLLIRSRTLESSRVVQALHATFGMRARTRFQRFSIHLRKSGAHHLRGCRGAPTRSLRQGGIPNPGGILRGSLTPAKRTYRVGDRRNKSVRCCFHEPKRPKT